MKLSLHTQSVCLIHSPAFLWVVQIQCLAQGHFGRMDYVVAVEMRLVKASGSMTASCRCL